MVTEADLREIVGRMAGVEEKSHFGRPDFRVRNRIFATLWPLERRVVVRLPRERQHCLAEAEPATFSIPRGGGERSGWLSIDLTRIAPLQLRDLLEESWLALPRPRPRLELPRKRP